jgi:diheme cytochrome c
MRPFILAALLAALALPAGAEERIPGIADASVKKECGACHMPYPPQFLPQRSWQKIMDTLGQHFGEDASLAEEQRKPILGYLLANAADVVKLNAARKFAAGIPPSVTPLRITETPRWIGKHREVRAGSWTDPKVKSKANCIACHTGADRGIYEDD